MGVGLDLAYVKLSDFLTPGLNLTVGRQELKIGEGFVIGSQYDAMNDPTNLLNKDLGLQAAFDAVKLDYKAAGAPLSWQAFMTKIYENVEYSQAYHDYDGNLYGLSLLYAPDQSASLNGSLV